MIERTPTSPPVTSGTRCLYAAFLVAAVGTVAFGALAGGEGNVQLLAPAALSGLVAWLLRRHLAESGTLAACETEDDAPVAVHILDDDAHGAAYRALLARAASLETLRGTAGFDPWEYQELRRQLHARRAAAR